MRSASTASGYNGFRNHEQPAVSTRCDAASETAAFDPKATKSSDKARRSQRWLTETPSVPVLYALMGCLERAVTDRF